MSTIQSILGSTFTSYLRGRSLLATLAGAVTVLACGVTACTLPSEEADPGASEDALSESKHLGMTDLTIVYPLPKAAADLDYLMSPSSEGSRGELFGENVFAQLDGMREPTAHGYEAAPTPQPRGNIMHQFNGVANAPWGTVYSQLRIVGVRIDPCFAGTSDLGAASCEPMIRMVAQFINPASPGDMNPNALHLFYRLTKPELAAVTKQLLGLRVAARLPLQKGFVDYSDPPADRFVGFGVHPTLVKEGLAGPYARGLQSLLLTYAGSKNLVQVAVAAADVGGVSWFADQNSLTRDRTAWIFGRFDVRHETLYGQAAPALTRGIQRMEVAGRIDRHSGTPPRSFVSMVPEMSTRPAYFGVLEKDPSTLTEAEWAPIRRSAFSLLDPTKTSAHSADCATCHAADQGAALPWGTPTPAYAFRSNTWRLDSTPAGRAPMRMMGWVPQRGWGGPPTPVLAARVVNETAMALDYVNKSVMK